jgi:hypothetical protein
MFFGLKEKREELKSLIKELEDTKLELQNTKTELYNVNSALDDGRRELEIVNKIREKAIPIDEPEYENSIVLVKQIDEILRQLEDNDNNTIVTNI